LSRPTAAILLTGNELLRGVIADANTSHLARSLEGHGIRVRRTLTVGDGVEEIAEGLRLALDGVDLVVTSGGLGPTHDDRTVEAIAGVAGVPLVLDEAILARITRWTDEVAARNDFPPERFAAGNRKQAHVLAGSSVLGLAGTAPALVARIGDARVVILPGVPSELRRLWELAPEHPELAGMFERARPRRRYVLRTYGVGESHVGDLFASLGGDPPGVETSICARNYEIEVDIRAEAGAEAAAQELAGGLRELLADHLFAEDERPVAELVLDLLRARGWTLATAESCTGGLVAARLTSVPGSSDVFRGSVVAYANDVKEESLGVPGDILERFGAVSAESAEAMARGVRDRLGVDLAVAVTGVAGPGGGTEEKPVGLVFAHAIGPDGERSVRTELPGDREMIRGRATAASLHLVRRLLESRDASP
jgi:competence/damage-inducible protein CinA-like protein